MNVGEVNINYPIEYKNSKTATTSDEVQFSKNIMKCVAGGAQKVMLCSDAIMSYASPQTGESVNVYRADNYSKNNPVYVIKGLDANGNAYEQEINASRINPNNCNYNELMVLNAETGHTSPGDYLHLVAIRDKSETGSYFETADYISCAKEVMSDMKTLGSWDLYLSYEKWINDMITSQQGSIGLGKSLWSGDMVVTLDDKLKGVSYGNSGEHKNKDEMTIDEYKQWFMNETAKMPVSGWMQSNFSSATLVIKDEAFERMKNDPEYEEYVMKRIRSYYSASGINTGMNNAAYEVIGASPEECYGYAGPVGGSGSERFTNKTKSWWERRYEKMEELIRSDFE